MIRKLRLKFIGVAMLSVFIVLLVLMVAINMINYKNVVEDADRILDLLEENNGDFPSDRDVMEWEDYFLEREEAFPEDRAVEIPYETRYFSVMLGENGTVISVNTGNIAAVSGQAAARFARSIQALSEDRGFISDYRYSRQELSGGTRILFLDCGKTLSTFHSFLSSSILVSVTGFLSVLILVTLFSGRIIKPVSESYEKQKRFITDAGHEIKTPLSIIGANAAVLEMEYGENQWISDIQKQTSRLSSLTNDLIYLSRMEENDHGLQRIDFPLSDLVSEISQSFQLLARTQNKNFSSHIQPSLSVRGDEKAIHNLLSILLDNALKYSTEEGDISLSLSKQGKNLLLSVSNPCEPISPSDLEHLFDRFYRTDPSRNSQTGGYGIGLSVARAIVSAHKGKITASASSA